MTDYYKKNEVNAIIQENNNTVTTNANSYADGKAASALADAKSYADTKDETTLTSAKGYADTKTASALADAKTYASGLIKDTETTTSSVWSGSKTNSTISSNLSTAKSYADGKASSALADAKSYTDSSLATLEVSLVYLSEELGEKDFPAE